jgi:TM2 domain-containing membrane protein YozV
LWWYARLATNRKSRIRALEHLLSLEPGHQKAEALLDKLDPIVDTTFDAPLYDPSPSYYDPEPSYYSASSGSESTQIERERLALERERLALERRRFQRQSDVNQAALAIGFIAAGFFGFFGVAHMVNGKIGEGIMRMIGGWVYLFIAGFVLGLTLFVAAIVIVPMHFVISYNDAKKGASYY